jgi:large subunit ribosomal protein L22
MTEKDYTPQKSEGKKMIVSTPKKAVEKFPVKKIEKQEKKTEEKEKQEIDNQKTDENKIDKNINKAPSDGGAGGNLEKSDAASKGEAGEEPKKVEEKKPIQTKPKVKKTEASINETSNPISTKHSVAICNFIKGKEIEKAIEELEKVVLKKKAVPMKGEIPHRKGKIMSGRFPKKAAQYFIKMLNRLKANADVNGLENVVITLAISNQGPKVYGRFGRTTKKRTHVKLIAQEKLNSGKNKK